MKIKENSKHITTDVNGDENGFLVPIYNVNDGFVSPDKLPEQVYATVIYPLRRKGPHKHFIRTGMFTCISGNAKFVLKTNGEYTEIYSGDDYGYRTVVVPTGTPALLINISKHSNAVVLNMPAPAWTPDMNDEYGDDFSDYDG